MELSPEEYSWIDDAWESKMSLWVEIFPKKNNSKSRVEAISMLKRVDYLHARVKMENITKYSIIVKHTCLDVPSYFNTWSLNNTWRHNIQLEWQTYIRHQHIHIWYTFGSTSKDESRWFHDKWIIWLLCSNQIHLMIEGCYVPSWKFSTELTAANHLPWLKTINILPDNLWWQVTSVNNAPVLVNPLTYHWRKERYDFPPHTYDTHHGNVQGDSIWIWFKLNRLWVSQYSSFSFIFLCHYLLL